MRTPWSERSKASKVAEIISYVFLFLCFLFEILEYTEIMNHAHIGSYISLIASCVADIFVYWNEKRSISYVFIGGACLMVSILIFVLAVA